MILILSVLLLLLRLMFPFYYCKNKLCMLNAMEPGDNHM